MCRFDKQGAAGFVIMIAGIYLLSNSINISPSCNWDQLTPTTCQNASDGLIKNSEVVTLTQCYQGLPTDIIEFYLLSQIDFVVNAPLDNSCLLYGCNINQCLKTTIPCDGSGTTSNSCVASYPFSDIEPPQAFIFFPLIIIIGLILIFCKRDVADTNKKIIGIGLIVFGIWFLQDSFYFFRSCDFSEETSDECGSGEDGQVKNNEIVQLSLCSDNGGPFAINPSYTDLYSSQVTCLSCGCSANQCLKSTMSCTNAGNPSYSCVNSMPGGFASPFNLITSLFILVLGIIILILGCREKDTSDDSRV